MWHDRSSLWGKFQITIWHFPNSELQKTHFQALRLKNSRTYVAIIMTNYFKLRYFNHFLRLFYWIISYCIILFLYFRMIREQSLLQIHVGGAHSQSGLRFVFWNLAGCMLLCGILCHKFCSLSSIFLETTFINCI